jgi:hypothetical protein
MSTPTLSPPRRSAGPETPAPGAPTRARPATRSSGYVTRARRVWGWSLAVSVAFHVIVFLLSPLVLRVGAPPGDGEQIAEARQDAGMRMIDPASLPAYTPVTPPLPMTVTPRSALPDPAAAPTQREAWQPPTRGTPGAPRPEGAPARREGQAGAADNPLRPGLRDPRLWVQPRDVERIEPSHEELHAEYMAGFERRLRGWNDSIAAEGDRARRATDWTTRDRNGGRWGLSPEGVHLGGITIPSEGFVPGGGDPDKRARAEQQERDRRAIDRQQADSERRRAQEDQIRATRERRNNERSGGRADP